MFRNAVPIALSVLAAAGCGSAGDTSTSKGQRIELRSTPSFNQAKAACGAVPRAALARTLGTSSLDPVSVAQAYADKHAPLAARRDVFRGCLAGLVR